MLGVLGVRLSLAVLIATLASLGQEQLVDVTDYLARVNATLACNKPKLCTEYFAKDSLCTSLPHTTRWDVSMGKDICAAIQLANQGDINYIPATGVASTRCIQDWKSDGRCDLPNNHQNENCEWDGGDCCLATCQVNCAEEPDMYTRTSSVCSSFCGEATPYLCLDETSVYSPVTQWCVNGQIKPITECYYSMLDVAAALLECILDDRAHGNEVYASAQCGNRSQACKEEEVLEQNGCHLPKDTCFMRPCCTAAFANGFIEANPEVLPTLQEVYERCEQTTTGDDEPCFRYMVKCIQDNRAMKGGCCQCSPGWWGWRCRQPLCWPQCQHGNCVAPNLCFCETGWKGRDCSHPLCDPECVPGQGTCVKPGLCECFYGWTGDSCQLPDSVPACVNGDAIAPDICKCTEGWGGRICDYPLCQSWPSPTSDCGHGSCVTPWKCECEPAWAPYSPINSTGYTIPPWWSKGQDVSAATTTSFVGADSRMIFLSYWDRLYNSSNAEQCLVPDCAQVFDPRCTACDAPPGNCTQCKPGYFLRLESGRCERCSLAFPHCQLCGRVNRGPEHEEVLTCTHCDPLFFLEPAQFASHPSGRCVSDGAVEFSSPVYHVYKDEVNVTLVVLRSTYTLDAASAKPAKVLVRTRDATARSRSLAYGEDLAGFEFTSRQVTLGVDSSIQPPPGGAGGAQWDAYLKRRVQASVAVPLRIYDDASYHQGLRYFDVDLLLPPEHLVGHQGPLRPYLEPHDHETMLGWRAPQNFGRTPLFDREGALATTRVYIWDRDESTTANTTCRGDCQSWWIKTLIHERRMARISPRTHFGEISNSPRDRFLIKYQPMGQGFEDSVGIVTEAIRDPNDPGTFVGYFTPIIPGPYKVAVEKGVPGVLGHYWWHNAVHRTPPRLPDTIRVDHTLDFYWHDTGDAPAFVRWQFYLHFECIRSARWPLNFGHALGILASPGSRVAAYFWNDGLIEDRTIPYTARTWNRTELTRHDCLRKADGSPAKDSFLCVEMLDHSPVVDPLGIYSFVIEYTSPLPAVLAQEQAAYVQIVIYHQNETDYWSWWPVQQKCLHTNGLHINGSPYEGFEAHSGTASPLYSTVMTLDGNTEEVELLVDSVAYLRVDLRDTLGAPFYGGEQMLPSITNELRTLGGVPDGAAVIAWDAVNRYYSLTFTAKVPAIDTDNVQAGRYVRELHVFLDGTPITFSPLKVVVLMGFSDSEETRIIAGSYTPARASEQMWFQVQSADEHGNVRTTGGDVYEVHFEGPAHDLLPIDRSFRGVVKDNLDGTYNVNFEIQRPGLYNMHIFLRNNSGAFSVYGSPFRVTVFDELDPGLTTASGPGVDPPAGSPAGTLPLIRAGELMNFTVTARDTYDTQYFEGGGRFRLTIDTLDEERGDSSDITDHGDGTYGFSYRVCLSGLARMEVLLYKDAMWHHIQGSPFTLDVVPNEVQTQLSVLHPLDTAAITFVPTSARIDLRDNCGNIPFINEWGDRLGLRLVRLESDEELAVDVAQTGLGEVKVFWTPGRRGLHELSAQLTGADILGSPHLFNVTPAGAVPTHAGAEWIVGGVGASSYSTFELLDSPADAAQAARILIYAKDTWGDPLWFGNDTFLVGLWREGGPCPAPARCFYFSQNSSVCGQVPSCRFDPYRRICHSSCGPAATPASFMLNLPEADAAVRLADPSVDVSILSAKEDVYEFAFTTPIAGRYMGTVSVLRPGGLRFFYFDSEHLLRCIHSGVLKGPVEFNWGFAGPPGPVPANRFALVAVGWLRVPSDGVYTLYFESDGTGRVFVNGTEILRTASGSAVGQADVHLRAGFSPLQVEYVHQPTQRAAPSHMRLSYSGGRVEFQVVPADAVYFEDILTQAGNPFQHEVKPLTTALALSIDGSHVASAVEDDVMVRAKVVVGQELTLRFHSVDRHGNVLVYRDPASLVHLYAEPTFTSGQFQGIVMVAERWRVVPLTNGSWNVILRPQAAPAVYDLTLELKSMQVGGIAFRRKLRVYAEPSEVYPPNCQTFCMPPAPQPVGTEVTCTVITRDREGNELLGLQVPAEVLPPLAAASERTTALSTEDGASSQFYFTPTVPGTWTVVTAVSHDDNQTTDLFPVHYDVQPGPTSMTNTQVVLPSILLTGEQLELSFTMRDYYGNLVVDDSWPWRAHLRGGHRDSVDLAATLTALSLSTLQAVTPPVVQRAHHTLTIEHIEARHRNHLSYCPELTPVLARVVMLSDHRALGSVALLRCLSGYERSTGETRLRCEEAPDGTRVGRGVWRDLRSLRASILICRPRPFWCPSLDIPNSELTLWGWRREVGSRAAARCRAGYQHLFGDMEFVCGSRDGVGTWLTPDGDAAIMPVCKPIQQLCPNFQLVDSHIVNMSEERIIGSVVYLACDPGFDHVGGHDVVVCDGDGQWKRPEVAVPALPPDDLQCFRGTAFCSDPSHFVQLGTRLRGEPQLQLDGLAEFECIEGWERLLGDTAARCSRSRIDDSSAAWFHADLSMGGQVDFLPLQCTMVQDWCPPLSVAKGHVVSLSYDYYLGSRAELACAVGFERINGSSTFECVHNENMTGGVWLAPDGSNLSNVLKCGELFYFCPEPIGAPTVLLSVDDGLRLGSVLTASCANGYELDVPLERLPQLVCQSGPEGLGQWTTPDGLATPIGALSCRGIRNWCPELDLPDGTVTDLEGARAPGSTAVLSCNFGYELRATERSYPHPEKVRIRCDVGTDPSQWWLFTDGGVWTFEGDNGTMEVACKPIPAFCTDIIPAFTSLNGVYQEMDRSQNHYTVDFGGERGHGSRATLRCNEVLKYYYSYGDAEIVCGYDVNTTGSVWRGLHGHLAVPLHCYYTGTPVLDYIEIRDGCFDTSDYVIGHYLGRSGSIVFWVRPVAWPPGSLLVQGEHGGGQWELSFDAEGMLSARVAPGIGHVVLDMTQNGTRGLGEWYHVAFIWELGLGLAGHGEVRLSVDGIYASPASSGSHRLNHFTWVDPSNKIHMGAVMHNETMPGNYSNLRVYNRPAPEGEIRQVRESEDPRCGVAVIVCARPVFVNAHVARVDNPWDARFALFPQRTDAQLSLECLAGYTRVSGDQEIQCIPSGAWLRTGSTAVALPLECCGVEEDFCPPLNLTGHPGLFILSSAGPDTVPCVADNPGGDTGMGVAYLPCPAISLAFGTVVYSDGYSFGSRASLSCDAGFEPLSELEMSTELLCVSGVFNYTRHPDAVVPGDWTALDERPMVRLQCRGLQNWCAEPQLLNGMVLQLSAHRRAGSAATMACLPGFEGSWRQGSVQQPQLVAVCMSDGNWTAGDSPLSAFSCEAVPDFCPVQALRPQTGLWGSLVPAPEDSYNVTLEGSGEIGSVARVNCSGTLEYSYGDAEVVCGYNMADQGGVWLGLSGRHAVQLHCHDRRPQVPDAAWFSDEFFMGGTWATKVPHEFGSEGSVAVWMLLSNASDRLVAWSSGARVCGQDQETDSAGPAQGLPLSNASNASNVSFADGQPGEPEPASNDSSPVNETFNDTNSSSVSEEPNATSSVNEEPNATGSSPVNEGQNVTNSSLVDEGPNATSSSPGNEGQNVTNSSLVDEELNATSSSPVNEQNVTSSAVNDGPNATNESVGAPLEELNGTDAEGDDSNATNVSSDEEEVSDSQRRLNETGEPDPFSNYSGSMNETLNDTDDSSPVSEMLNATNSSSLSEETNASSTTPMDEMLNATNSSPVNEELNATSPGNESDGDDNAENSSTPLLNASDDPFVNTTGNSSELGNTTEYPNRTATASNTTTTTTTATASASVPTGNGTLCLGEQHMVIMKGVLSVQFGHGIGNFSVPLSALDEAEWLHVVYVWSGLRAEASLYVNSGTPGLVQENLSTDLTLDAQTAFELYVGAPPTLASSFADFEDGRGLSHLRTYTRPLSGGEVMDLLRVEVPGREALCLEPPHFYGGLNGSSVVAATSSYVRVPPAAHRRGTKLHLECDPGYLRTGGSSVVECSEDEDWVEAGTNVSAQWLECCFPVQDFCKELNETYMLESWVPSALCGPHFTPEVRSNSTVLRRLGARVAFECPTGYLAVSGTEQQRCALSINGSASGEWVDADGAPAAPFECELEDHWCPTLQGHRSYVPTVTAGRRLGSIAFFICVGTDIPLSGNVTLRCVTRSDGRGGHWVDSYGNEASPLRCGKKAEEIFIPPTIEGSELVTLDRRFRANASLACISTTRKIYGDGFITCATGPSPLYPSGAGGRWADHRGDSVELPVCELRPEWCTRIEIDGLNSTVDNLTDNYRHGSIASLRCHVGYKYESGNETLECLNDPTSGKGLWDGSPLACELAPHFCPPMWPINASVVEDDLQYTLGEVVSFQCHRGFAYLSGDYNMSCQLGDGTLGASGQWKRADGTAASFLVCTPKRAFCSVPEVEYGHAVSLTFAGRLGSVVELECLAGHWDPHLRVDRQLAVCLPSAQHAEGAFVTGMAYTSRDLLKAIAFVGDLVEMLEEHEALPFRIEDVNSTARLEFSSRWSNELRTALRALRHDRLVAEVLDMLPGYDAQEREPLSYLRSDHVRVLHRLLVSKADETHDIPAMEARSMFGSYSTLKVSFQDAATPAPDGWLRDSGDAFGERANGYSYGWKCDVGDRALNSGAFNRDRDAYSVLENTLVATDLYSWCDNQEWRIELPSGRYYVEVVIQDPQHEASAAGCMLQGEYLDFPSVVPPGKREGRHLMVDVVDFLTFTGDGDAECSSVNRITVQSVEDAGARPGQDPLLRCEKIPEWCAPFEPPENTHVSTAAETALGRPLGGTVSIECDRFYTRESGSQDFVCGSDPTGRFGQWLIPGGRREWHPLTCGKSRDLCPPPALASSSIITSISPPSYEYYTKASFACRSGLRRVSGDASILCDAPGEWCAEGDRGTCAGDANYLQCELEPEYCPALPGAVYDGPKPWDSEAAAVSNAGKETPHVAWVSLVMPVPAAPLGTEASLACPEHYRQVQGDLHVVCQRGASTGVWQKVGAPTTQLVDDALAEPVVCELEPVYGARRQLFRSASQFYLSNTSVGSDVVPNIDQSTADYDAAHFQTHIRPHHNGTYRFSVEVLGKFTLALEGQVLLEGRSTGADPELFEAEAVNLSASEFHALTIQYTLDPLFPGRSDYERLPRLVRLLWSSDGMPRTIVPPTVLRHDFEMPQGLPITLLPVNDPEPCISGQQEEFTDLQVGTSGVLVDGSPDRNYNPDLHCLWRLRATDSARFVFTVNHMDMEDTPGCAADRVELRAGTRTGAALLGSFCGYQPPGTVLVDMPSVIEILVDFVTDGAVEGPGFNISWAILETPPLQQR